jgi:small subunit ribosomal protein S1
MANRGKDDELKRKFRPNEGSKLDEELDSLLGGDLDSVYGFGAPDASRTGANGTRKGRILSINPKRDEVLVDFGGKSQGIAVLSEFENEPKVGDEVEFDVDRFDAREGLLILKRRGAVNKDVTWEKLDAGQVVEGTVTGVNKGGLELTIRSMRAFMPAGQVDVIFHEDLSVFLNQKLTCEVTQFDREAKNLIVSRRVILEREKEKTRQQTLEEIQEGQIRRGTVRNVMDFGAFVDLGGLDGLLHVSEMSHRRGRTAREFVKVGDIVDVKVVKLDRETGKMSLSLKHMMPDPWVGVETRYGVGTTATGRVTRIENFGAFIEVEEGLEGLLPISEMSWQRIRHPSECVQENQLLRLAVIAVDPVAKRMTLSLKQAAEQMPKPAEASGETAAPKYESKHDRSKLRGGLER